MAIEGVDYSFARPDPRGLAAAGKHFAVRYGAMGTSNKWLTASELKALRAAGLDVVANVEGTKGGYTGTAAGQQWAASGDAFFRALGMPPDRPIYFSVDWNATSADWAGIDAALRASATVIGKSRVGVYGSYNTIEHCRAAGTAAWFWQTYAWSGGREHSAAHLYQYHNGVTIAGGDCDLTRALKDDYGQWEAGMAITDAEIEKIRAAVWGTKIGNVAYPNRTALTALNDLSVDRDQRQDKGAAVPKPPAGSFYAAMLAEPAAVAALSNNVIAQGKVLAQLVEFATNEAAEVPVSARQIADAILAGLIAEGPQDAAHALVAVLGAEKATEIAQIILGTAPQ
jgi:hypothetical protein